MLSYIRWSLRQLYLFCYWPSQLQREIEGDAGSKHEQKPSERLDYLLKLLPWTAIPAALLIGVLWLADHTASFVRSAPETRSELDEPSDPAPQLGEPFFKPFWRVHTQAEPIIGTFRWLPAAIALPTGLLVGLVFGVGFGPRLGIAMMSVGTMALVFAFQWSKEPEPIHFFLPLVSILVGLGLATLIGLLATESPGTTQTLWIGLAAALVSFVIVRSLVSGPVVPIAAAVIAFAIVFVEMESYAGSSTIASVVRLVLAIFGGGLTCLLIAARLGGLKEPFPSLDSFAQIGALANTPGGKMLLGLGAAIGIAVLVAELYGGWSGLAVGLAESLFLGFCASLSMGPVRASGFLPEANLERAALVSSLWGIGFALAFRSARGIVYGINLGLGLGMVAGALVSLFALLGVRKGIDFLQGYIIILSCGLSVLAVVCFTYFRILAYPFDLALASLAYLRGRWHPEAATNAWNGHPVRWNELLWLPIPFAVPLLAAVVRRDRARGLREIALVAAERKLQYRAARLALVEVAIADLRGKNLKELAGVIDRIRWTTDHPIEASLELSAALPRFDLAAQYLGQVLTLQSPYRQSEVLERAREEIEGLQRSLIAAHGPASTRLLQVANDWHQIIMMERRLRHVQADTVGGLPNPYIFGNPVTEREDNIFAGRRGIVRQVEESLLGARHTPTILLHGPRRMGKTSILYQLPRLLGPEFAPALVDCQNPAVTSSEATLLRHLTRAVSLGLQRRRVAIEPIGADTLAREPFALFDSWLDMVERTMPSSMRVLICLDEYESLQRVFDRAWGVELLDALRHTLQHRPRITLMFTGAHTFEEQGAAWTDRFVSARRIRVSFLSLNEVVPLLTEPIPSFDLTYAPGAIHAVFEATRGQPFLTQAVAFELVQLLNEQERRAATEEDVAEAIQRALVSSSEYFANVWYDAGDDGQQMLRAIAQGLRPPEYHHARAWLVEHDILTASGTFAVPMTQAWVLQQKLK